MKLELDISEKERVLAEQRKPEDSLRLLAFYLGSSQLALLLVVRYVLLELTLRLWGVVPTAGSTVTGTLVGRLYMVTGGGIFSDDTSMVVMSVAPQVLVVVLRLVEWVIFFGIG